MLVPAGDTKLFVEERGTGFPLFVLHGGPGLDHHMFGDYLDPLGDAYRLLLVDQRSQGRSDRASRDTWTLEHMASDVNALADSLGLDRWAVLGHSYGAFVVLQNAVDHPGRAAASIVSSGVPGSRFLMSYVEAQLAAFEPESLREQVTGSWEREKSAQTQQDCDEILRDQLAFQFRDPFDPRIADFSKRTAGMVFAPDVLRFFANSDYGGIEVEDRLGSISQPVMVLAGRGDRTCSIEAAEATAAGIKDAELVVFERSAHMTYVEEQDAYLDAVRSFLDRTCR